MRRGVVIYLEDKHDLMLQFGCLYTSIKYIHAKHTDLIVFGTQEALNKVPDDCIKAECDPISYQPEWHHHHYINSIYCLVSDNSDFLDEYDFLLRSDVDTFLTSAWSSYFPDSYTVGQGAYVHDDEVRDKIKRIADKFGMSHRGIHNIGSTHYGNSGLVREVCRLTLPITQSILNEEFTEGPGKWPGWYQGVAILYGSEIAVNHLVDSVSIDGEKLDYFSTSTDTLADHPHIHSWHTDEMFSKFQFAAGMYDHVSMENLNPDRVRDYCLYIALKSRREMPELTENQ